MQNIFVLSIASMVSGRSFLQAATSTPFYPLGIFSLMHT